MHTIREQMATSVLEGRYHVLTRSGQLRLVVRASSAYRKYRICAEKFRSRVTNHRK
ncbi:unnamed protein product [Angiostrongylus costaricensis]|uniref:Type II toxin-antitoxin system prevent-host-death family antitoxin n=1 Tax=Angiostrongylus costaricensis TaxID=334426 RepID=A0A0R3PPQ0_ANGCS|nr:unnamed protein product [Angiostrongylus costaricensis]